MDSHAGEAGNFFFVFPLGGVMEVDVLSVLSVGDFLELNPAGGRVAGEWKRVHLIGGLVTVLGEQA